MPASPHGRTHASAAALVLAVLLAGVLAGLAGILLSIVMQYGQVLVYGRAEDPGEVLTAGLDPLRGAVAVSVAGVVLAFAWWALRRWGRPIVRVGDMAGADRPSISAAGANALIQTVGVAAGLPVGREAAPRELAAVLAARVTSRLGLSAPDRALLVAAAAGGALGAVYQVPLAGAVYAVEILLRQFTARTMAICLMVSALATAVARLGISSRPQFTAAPVDSTDPVVLAWAVGLGLVLGPLGGWFGDMSSLVRRRSQRGAWVLVTLPLAGVLVGAAALVEPLVLGNGRSAAQSAYLGMGLGVAALALVVKVPATLLTLRAGAVGGTLAPAIAAGALAATVLGRLVELAVPVLDVPVAELAVLGAAAVLATSLAAPVTGLLLVVGTAGMDHSALLAMTLAVAAAFATSRLRPRRRRLRTADK